MTQNGHKLMSDLLEVPIPHIPAERVRSAALTVAEAGLNVWSVDDVRDVLNALGVSRRELTEGMFHV